MALFTRGYFHHDAGAMGTFIFCHYPQQSILRNVLYVHIYSSDDTFPFSGSISDPSTGIYTPAAMRCIKRLPVCPRSNESYVFSSPTFVFFFFPSLSTYSRDRPMVRLASRPNGLSRLFFTSAMKPLLLLPCLISGSVRSFWYWRKVMFLLKR